jgi:hypothetical protein
MTYSRVGYAGDFNPNGGNPTKTDKENHPYGFEIWN